MKINLSLVVCAPLPTSLPPSDLLPAVGARGAGADDMSVRGGAGAGTRGAPQAAGGDPAPGGEGAGGPRAAHAPAGVRARLLQAGHTGPPLLLLFTKNLLF